MLHDCTASGYGNPAPVVVSAGLTLAHVFQLEPRIAGIINQAAAQRGSRIRRYEAAKQKLRLLVGWYARRPALSSSEVYEAVMRELARRVGV